MGSASDETSETERVMCAANAAMDRATAAERRLDQCEQLLRSLTRQFHDLLARCEAQETLLGEANRCRLAAEEELQNIKLLSGSSLTTPSGSIGRHETPQRQADADTKSVGSVSLHEMPSLGLRIGQSSNGVVVLETRGVSSAAGVCQGDVIQSVSYASEWRIRSVDDYRYCVADMPLSCDVRLRVTRGEEPLVIALRPDIIHTRS